MRVTNDDLVGVDSLQHSCWNLARAYAQGIKICHGNWPDAQLLRLAHYIEQDSSVSFFAPTNATGSAVQFPRRYDIANMIGGGIDSFIAHFQASYSPIRDSVLATRHVNLWIDYGQPYAAKELAALTRLKQLVPGFNFYTLEIPSPYKILENFDYLFPCRNLFIASLGTVDATNVWISANKRDAATTQGARDKTPHFFAEATDIFSRYYDREVTVSSPQITQSKAETIQWYLDQGWPVEWLFEATTCYHPTKLKCGECYSCTKRFLAFWSLGILEPGYAIDPRDAPKFAEYMDRERRKGRDVSS